MNLGTISVKRTLSKRLISCLFYIRDVQNFGLHDLSGLIVPNLILKNLIVFAKLKHFSYCVKG